MPSFAEVYGIALPIAKKRWDLTPTIVGGSDDRADDGTLLSSQTVRKREWASTFVVGTEVEREAFRRLIEGDGLHVDFDDATGFSWSGLGPKTATSVTYNASGGKRGGRAIVGSSGVLEYALAKVVQQQDGDWAATKGWTVAVFKKLLTPDTGFDGTFKDHLATGNVVVVRGASANPAGVTQYKDGVAGSWNMGNWLSVDADGDVGIHGYSNAGAAAAYDYDELLVLPFALPPALLAAWATALATFRATYPVGRLPRVKLFGDCIASDTVPLEVRCRVSKSDIDPQFLGGGFAKNARVDDVTVRQV